MKIIDEKALDCRDAISELHDQLNSLYEDNFENTQKDFENQLDKIARASSEYTNAFNAMSNKSSKTIPKLREELAALEATMNEAVNESNQTSTRTVTTQTPTMRYGSTGDNVLELQTKLHEMGLYIGALDGWWGDMTESAVRAYQELNGLIVDGIAGEQTLTSLGMFSKTVDEIMDGAVGGIEKYSEAWYSMQQAIDDIKEQIAEAYAELFDETAQSYENQLSIIAQYSDSVNTAIEKAENKGYLLSKNYYTALSQVEKANIDTMQQELSALEKSLKTAMDEGKIEKYSQQWWEMSGTIYDVRKAIDEANVSLLEYEKTMRELDWSNFEFVEDRISAITDESNFLIDLMSNDNLYQDNGQFNKQGRATAGLRAQNFDVYMSQADDYAKKVRELNKQISANPYNTDLIKKREEYNKLQMEAIKNAESEKQAIKSLVEGGIKIELQNLKDVIDTYKEEARAQKDLYDYQKNVADQTKAIAALRKQLSAYQGDDSEETRAKIQKISVDLADAEEKLRETEADHVLNETDKMLTNLYDEYEEAVNARLDNVDALLADIINATNASSGDISNTITSEAASVGYKLTEEMRGIWTGEGGISTVVSTYGASFDTKLTTINTVLSSIDAKIQNLLTHSASEVPNVSGVASVGSNIAKEQAASQSKPKASASNSNNASKAKKSDANAGHENFHFTDDLRIGSTGDQVRMLQEALRKYSSKFSDLDIDGVFGKYTEKAVMEYQKMNGLAIDGWVGPVTRAELNKIRRYKTGGLVDQTGLAYLDGTKRSPEMVLNASDTKNFIALKDVLSTNAMPAVLQELARMPKLNGINGFGANNTINGGINIQVVSPQDYNDFLNQMRDDKNFEKLVQAMTTDRLVGRSYMQKNGYRW